MFEMLNKYDNMDKKEAEKELNREIEDMMNERIKLIDEEFSGIKSKIGKDIVKLIKQIDKTELELQKESVIRVIKDENPVTFSTLFDSPVYDELNKLYDKLDALSNEYYNKVNQDETAP